MSNLEQSCFLSFRIVSWKSLGTLFKIIEAEKVYLGMQTYALSETSLDQVFLSFVADQVFLSFVADQATLDSLE